MSLHYGDYVFMITVFQKCFKYWTMEFILRFYSSTYDDVLAGYKEVILKHHLLYTSMTVYVIFGNAKLIKPT